jgi:hypothetical protein
VATNGWAPDVLLGGDRGDGKSYGGLLAVADYAAKYGPDMRALVVRQTYPALEDLMVKAYEILPEYGATFHAQASAERPIANGWYFPNGAVARFQYVQNMQDYRQTIHGKEYCLIFVDEAGDYADPAPIMALHSVLRSSKGVPCRFRIAANPGGPGQAWLREMYVDRAPPGKPFLDPDTGMERMWIEGKRAENVALTANDPQYEQRIMAATVGNDALRKAWLHGDWHVVAGAFFSLFRTDKHVIRPFAVPSHWVKFAGFDFGSAAPFSVLWLAVSDGESLPDGRRFPRGALIVYREWYGCNPRNQREGLHMHAEAIAQGIVKRTGEKLDYAVSDPACWAEAGGPSIASRMALHGFHAREGDNARIAGWDQVNARLDGVDGNPMLYVFDVCTWLQQHIKLAQRDEKRIEDVDTDCNDHDLDALRYGCMSYPYIRALPKPPDNVIKPWEPTFRDMVNRNRRREAREA